MNRKQFIQHNGATCSNWNWSWSFINEEKKFIIFGEWEHHHDGAKGLIFSENWEFRNGRRQKGYNQSREHIQLIQEGGYKLMTFPMTAEDPSAGDLEPTRIKDFERELTEKNLIQVGNSWYAEGAASNTSRSIPEGILREHVLEAISRFNAGIPHQFADSTAYDLLHDGNRYPPKAIVGMASEVLTGIPFSPKDFKGGLDSKCFRILEENGFEIVPKLDADEQKEKGSGWTRDELKASVETYLEIQKKQKAGEDFTKKSQYQLLADRFGRTIKSVEYRMQNISYVLSLHGRDWIQGLPPAKNVGTNIAAEIESILAEVEGREVSPSIAFEAAVQTKLDKGDLEPPAGEASPKKITSTSTGFERNPEVKAWVLNNAKGTCESCEQRAPFMTATGQLFLEVHHVKSLADEGSDRIENAVAICPNCHRAFHYSRDKGKMLETLFSRITRLVRE